MKQTVNIEEAQRRIVNEFAEIDDPLSEYELLLRYAAELPSMTPSQKAEAKLAEGCQSQVWLSLKCQSGIFTMQADSDTLIIRGILNLLCNVVNGKKCSEVASCEFFFLEEANLMATFDIARKSGIASILNTIRSFAQASSQQCNP